MKTRDLQELLHDPSVPVTVKPYLHSELAERGALAEEERTAEQPVYEVSEESDLETDESAEQRTVPEDSERPAGPAAGPAEDDAKTQPQE
jgi:hypothetical protein